MLKVIELFAGIGAPRSALERLGIEFEVVGISEIDKYAVMSYEAMYGKTKNYGDISKIERLDSADLWFYGFPCQDISLAGKQSGIVRGKTRSGLLYEVQRLLQVASDEGTLPKFLILENVRNLVSDRFLYQFKEWIDWLYDLGYVTEWRILNTKDYGIPQNRERVFAISVRRDVYKGSIPFPKAIPLEIKLIDMLEKDVDTKFYLSDEQVRNLQFTDEPTMREISKTIRVGGRGSLDKHEWDCIVEYSQNESPDRR